MTAALTAYSSVRTLTLTLASLASTTGLLSGRESNSIVSSGILAVDYQVAGTIVQSSAGATANKQIEVWAYGSVDGTTFSAGATGSDADLTIVTKSLMKLLTVMPTVATASQSYNWGPFSVAQAFGGAPPLEWGLFVTQNSCAALNASGHTTQYIPIYYTSS